MRTTFFSSIRIAFGLLACLWSANAQPVYEPRAFSTLAGLAGSSGADDNIGSLARFNQPWGLAADGASNLYVADTLNHAIRKVAPNGTVTILAGVAGSAGFADGPSASAQFSRPTGLAVNQAGTVIYVADYNNHVIRQISGGAVSTLAGTVGVFGVDDGPGLSAKFRNPFGLALNSAETVLYVTDQNNQTIRSIDLPGGAVGTVAGIPNVSGSADGPNATATFNTPRGLAVDASGNLYVADAGNLTVRKILASGGVSTLAGLALNAGFTDGTGSGARFSALQAISPFGGPCGVALDGSGNVYVSDQGNHTLRKITAAGVVTTLAGTPQAPGSADGLGSAAAFRFPAGVAANSAGNLYVADAVNHTIRYYEHTNSTPCLTVVCAPDKTVTCGSDWSFDPPSFGSPGSPGVPALELTVLSTITNSLCPLVITRAWLATDACGNTSPCSQTVTVAPSLIPNSPAVISGPIYNPANGHFYYLLDENTWTASEAEAVALGGHLATVRSQAENDWIYAQFSQFGGVNRGLWIGLNDANAVPDGGFVWASGEPVSYLNWGQGEPVNQNGLDDYVHLFWPGDARAPKWNDQWDIVGSEFGSIPINGVVEVSNFPPQLTCATNKTVACGTPWEFDAPSANDPCSGANVAVTVVSTLTNSLCPLVLTRTWLATDACGNTNTCSQTVTVVDHEPPVFACPAAKTVPCGTDWAFDTPTVQDACDSGNISVAVLNTVTNGVCPQVITRTWQAADACGNISTCSQAVTIAAPASVENCAACESWTAQPNTGPRIWSSVASSADGSRLAATVSGGAIYTSSDYGATWTAQNSGLLGWWSIASSSDGSKLAAAASGGLIHTSSDYGVTWTAQPGSGVRSWYAIASDAAGLNLVAVADNSGIYVSHDSGVTWALREGPQAWRAVASSATGSHLAAAVNGGLIYTSSDFGATWTPRVTSGGRDWYGLASSADGGKLAAIVEGGGQIYTSSDFGANWTARETARNWHGIASSADGSKLVAVVYNGQIHCSEDFGVTWTAHETTRYWHKVASSADGRRMVAPEYTGLIYTAAGCPPSAPPALVCAPDKTVECGSRWSFDPPALASSCGGQEPVVTVLSTVSSGTCPRLVTRAWEVVDACGNTNVCRQTVTIVDTTPPILACPKERIIVPLNADCRLQIPEIRPKATDNCGSPKDLVYMQEPAAGAVVSGSSQVVTVTVRDACGNIARCQVTVIGQDKLPPVVVGPKEVTVTNCVTPNVLAQITATDNCTPRERLIISQSPPAGSPLPPGVTEALVTVSDQFGNTTTVSVALNHTQSLLGMLFNTGVDASRVPLPGGAVDPHYSLGPVPAGAPVGGNAYNAPAAVVVDGLWGLPPHTASKWIAPGANPCIYPLGSYIYTNEFVLPPGTDPQSVSIFGRWAADDTGALYLNGMTSSHQVSVIPNNPPAGYINWTYFTASSGFLPFPAVNRFYFVVNNTEEWFRCTGLRVEFLRASGDCASCAPPVILSSTPSQSRPLFGSAVFTANVSGTGPLSFQWLRNGLPLANGGHYSGVNTATLTIAPLTFADAGVYRLVVTNACGEAATRSSKLTVKKGWNPGGWSWWDFSLHDKPLTAVFGSDLLLSDSGLTPISAGSTRDFSLPHPGGRIASVLHMPPTSSNIVFLRVPLPESASSNGLENLTLLADVYAPAQLQGPAVIFAIYDRWGNLKISQEPGPDGPVLSAAGLVNGVINLRTNLMRANDWNRIAVTVSAAPSEGMAMMMEETLSWSIYLNGKNAGLDWTGPFTPASAEALITVFSSPEGSSEGIYASGLQFHIESLTPEIIASLGGPEHGPLPGAAPATSETPSLTASTAPGDGIVLSWTGQGFQLQETMNLDGPWEESDAFFEITEAGQDVSTTARIDLAPDSNNRFYRLIYAP